MIKVGVNLLFLLPGKVGGSEVYARRVISGLTMEQDLDLTLFCNRANMDTFEDGPRLHRVLVDYNAEDRWTRVRKEQCSLPKLVGRLGLDLLWSPGNTAPKKTSCPQAVSIMDLQHEHFPEYFGRVRLWTRRILFKRAIKGADRIIAISGYTAQDLQRLLSVDPERIEVIHLGADLDLGDVPQERVEEVRGRHRLPASFAFFPGKTFKHKNHGGAVLAVARLREKWGIDLPLVLAGGEDNGHEDFLDAVAASGVSDLVRHLGLIRHDDIPALYRLATCLLFPSRFEGFGLPVIEAFACGCPVICSNSSSLPEVAGDAALLVDPDDHEGMAYALRLVLREPDLARSLAERGRERARQLTWSNTISRTADLLRGLAARSAQK